MNSPLQFIHCVIAVPNLILETDTMSESPSANESSSIPLGDGSLRRCALTGIAVIVLLAALASGAYWALVLRYQVASDDAYVGGNLVQVNAQTAGTVKSIFANETQAVHIGQPLVQLDGVDAAAALAGSEAQLAKAVRIARGQFAASAQAAAGVSQRSADMRSAEANIAAMLAKWQNAQSELVRQTALAEKDIISDQALSNARSTAKMAHAQYDAAVAAAVAARAAIGGAREQFVSAAAQVADTSLATHPDVAAAAASVRQTFVAVARSMIVAPVNGVVGKRGVQLGQQVSPGAPLMTVVPLSDVWVDANFKETELATLRIGQPVTLVSDFYGKSVVFHGKVAGLSPATGSAQALLPAQNASGNWIKIVQRLPVRITLDPAEIAAHPLRVGLSMNVTVDIHDTGGTAVSAAMFASETTPIFDGAQQQAEARINQIIAANQGRIQ